jgi:hypothetical protein
LCQLTAGYGEYRRQEWETEPDNKKDNIFLGASVAEHLPVGSRSVRRINAYGFVIAMPRCCRGHAPRAPNGTAIDMNRDASRDDKTDVGVFRAHQRIVGFFNERFTCV